MHTNIYSNSSAISWLNRSRNIYEPYTQDFDASTGNQGLFPKYKKRGGHLQGFFTWLVAFLAKKTLPEITSRHTQKLFIQNQLKHSCRKNCLVYFITDYSNERGHSNGEKNLSVNIGKGKWAVHTRSVENFTCLQSVAGDVGCHFVQWRK